MMKDIVYGCVELLYRVQSIGFVIEYFVINVMILFNVVIIMLFIFVKCGDWYREKGLFEVVVCDIYVVNILKYFDKCYWKL